MVLQRLGGAACERVFEPAGVFEPTGVFELEEVFEPSGDV